MATYEDYVRQSTDSMNQMYDQQRTARLAELENSYQQSLSAAQAAKEAIPQTYQAQANDLAVQYERNKRNLNEQAAANGLNTGTASQAQLMANQGWMKNYGALRTAQANALNAADKGMADLAATHNASKESAMAQIEASRAQANLQIQQAAAQEQYARDLENAKLRAGFGDFSGFLTLGYDQRTVDNMRQVWIAQNPLLAYNTGALSAADYQRMTGKAAPGTPTGSTGYTGYYGDYVGASTGAKTGTAEEDDAAGATPANSISSLSIPNAGVSMRGDQGARTATTGTTTGRVQPGSRTPPSTPEITSPNDRLVTDSGTGTPTPLSATSLSPAVFFGGGSRKLVRE